MSQRNDRQNFQWPHPVGVDAVDEITSLAMDIEAAIKKRARDEFENGKMGKPEYDAFLKKFQKDVEVLGHIRRNAINDLLDSSGSCT